MANRYNRQENVAYQMTPGGEIAIEPNVREVPSHATLVKERKRARDRARRQVMAKYRVREQQAVAPLSIVGFFVVAALAAAVLGANVRLNAINKQVVQVNTQLSELQAQEKVLVAEYEQMFDLQDIEDRMVNSGTMVKPDSTQIIYLELAEPDSATVYQEEKGLLSGIWDRLSSIGE